MTVQTTRDVEPPGHKPSFSRINNIVQPAHNNILTFFIVAKRCCYNNIMSFLDLTLTITIILILLIIPNTVTKLTDSFDEISRTNNHG